MSGAGFDRRAVVGWSLYDFANSAFSSIVVTFIYAVYYTEHVASDAIRGTTFWSYGVTATALTVAILSPVVGAAADRGGFRRRWLLVLTAIAVLGSARLYWVLPGDVVEGILVFAVANVAYELACVFYNSFLPGIAPPDRIGRISGNAWALGYVGGVLAMGIALVGFINAEQPWFGFGKEAAQHVRATSLLTAVWFAAFSIPLFAWVREPARAPVRGRRILRDTYRELLDTLQHVRRYRQIVRLLLARLLYNDGLVTAFAFGGIYAQGTFGFSIEEVVLFGIALNVSAGIGAFALGFADDWLGGKRTIQISLVGLMFASLLAVVSPDKTTFWIAGILVGVFVGPNQAASRSLMGRFVPPDRESEFFGFFAFSGKATAFLGPALLGQLTRAFDTQRAGMAVCLVFFGIGGFLLHFVDEGEGRRASGRV